MPPEPFAAVADVAVDDSRDVSRSESIDNAITRPGAVRINVTGAFVTDEAPQVPDEDSGGGEHSEDIRLPEQTAVISHIAVDVR